MNVSLTPQLESLVRQKVESGLYLSSSEVIREALRLLEERDQFQALKKEELRREIKAGIEDLEQNGSSLLDIEDVIRRGQERRTSKMRGK